MALILFLKKYSQRDRDTLREELKILPNEILIGHIGRFVPEKNHSFIVDVFEDYMKVHPNSKLLLFGKGNLRENIISKCKEKGLYNKCIFIESVDNLDHYYSAMDVFYFLQFARVLAWSQLKHRLLHCLCWHRVLYR